jgi:hypothetical protein
LQFLRSVFFLQKCPSKKIVFVPLKELLRWRKKWRHFEKKKSDEATDIESLQNRLLKVCYVPDTSASLPRVSFFIYFLFFVAAAIDVLMKQTR